MRSTLPLRPFVSTLTRILPFAPSHHLCTQKSLCLCHIHSFSLLFSDCLSVRVSVCPSVSLSVCLSVCVSVCLSVCLLIFRLRLHWQLHLDLHSHSHPPTLFYSRTATYCHNTTHLHHPFLTRCPSLSPPPLAHTQGLACAMYLPKYMQIIHLCNIYPSPPPYHFSVPMPALSGRCNNCCGRLRRPIDHCIGGSNNHLLQVSINYGHWEIVLK